MASGTPFLFSAAKRKLMVGSFDLAADSLKAMLCTSAQALSAGFVGASGDARKGDLTGEVSGTGYTAGGQALTGVTVRYFVASATIAAAGSGGANGVQTVTGTTGTGTKFQAQVQVTGGAISAINSISLGGSYSALPTNPQAEPVTGGSLTGAQLNLVLGVAIDFDDPSWAASTLVAKYLVIYDDTLGNDDLLAAVDLETTVPTGVSTTAGTLTYQVNAAGFIQIN